MHRVNLAENIFYLGFNDRRTHLFENLWPIPYGVSYNSYLIVDEKIALIDTVERTFIDEYLEQIEILTDGRKVDYLVINHMEPDHSGGIKSGSCQVPRHHARRKQKDLRHGGQLLQNYRKHARSL